MRVLYLLLVFALWAPGQVVSQVNPDKKKELLKRRPPQKELATATVSDSIVPAYMILPDSLNKEYQQKFGNFQEILQINFKRNRSGKLPFCSDPNLFKKEWLNSRYRFANTPAELDRFERLLSQLNIYYLQPTLSQREQYQVLSITRDLLRMKNREIVVVDRSRKKVMSPVPIILKASTGIVVEFIPAKGKNNTRIEGTQVYAVKPSHFFDCETCGDCLAPDARCDLNTLKGDAVMGVIKIEPGHRIPPGSYYLFVTENDFEVERVIYYETREVTLEDAGKVIWLRVGG